jgi:hypothetical protein
MRRISNLEDPQQCKLIEISHYAILIKLMEYTLVTSTTIVIMEIVGHCSPVVTKDC